jgi:hypothetical protein
MWDDHRLRDQSPSAIKIGDLAKQQIARNDDASAFVGRHLYSLATGPIPDEAAEFVAVLDETVRLLRRQSDALSRAVSDPTPLTVGQATLYDGFLRLVSARPYSHLLRLANCRVQMGTNQAAEDARSAARSRLRAIAGRFSQDGHISAVDFERGVELQIIAIIRAATSIASSNALEE